MKTEFLEKLLPEMENRADIIKAIFAENGKDINAEKAKYADCEELKAKLTAAEGTIKEIEAAKGNTEELQKQLDAYKAEAAEREKAAAEEKAEKELVSRFDVCTGERKFIHPFVREGVIKEFANALNDESNKGKNDKEIFDNLTKDKDYFAVQNPMGSMGGTGSAAIDDDADARAIMGLPPKK